MVSWKAAGRSDRGRVRHVDEDAYLIDERLGLFLVADGVGGHNAGEVASRMAVDSIRATVAEELATTAPSEFDGAAVLEHALRKADRQIREAAARNEDYRGMATTVVALLARPGGAWVAHAGDSRAYLQREGQLGRWTEDHSAIAEMNRANPAVSTGNLLNSPIAHMVTQCLGREAPVSPDIRAIAVEAGDRILLCCDGLTDMVTDPTISTLLREEKSREECCRRLIEAANEAGGRDNVTVVVIDVPNGP
jgi:serine/threonine protein phosphatase PrpC